MNEIDPFKLFLELQLALPRNAPGSARATREAFSLLPALPPRPEIADLGCGQGAEAFELLRLANGRITAVDLFEPFLEKLAERAEREGVPETRLRVLRGDMNDLPFHDGEFDLIWSEGAIYLLGFEEGLRLWRRFLKPGGFAVLSELTWLTDAPSPEAAVFWEDAYPGMGSVASNGEAAARAGYRLIGRIVLPTEEWWQDYYMPMRAKLAGMRRTYGELPVFDEMEREICLFERHADEYGYVFYALRRD
ncbi:MAG: class I SAM-dependent methyltransferase [Parvibaculum sp.]|uniref:class I SAM-dependent methyltransferase n=1 Tax=Parvibaculum sp. TaxID=2024848 RepID=UPI003C780CF3